MKTVLFLALVHLIVFVHSNTYYKSTQKGGRRPNDVRLFAEDIKAPWTLGSARVSVDFPPKCLWRLKSFYKVDCIRVIDYNKQTASIKFVRGGIGQNELDIELESPAFQEIDVTVEYWGTFNVEKFLATPMDTCGYKPPYRG